MTFNKKEYEKDIINACNFLINSNNKKEHKKCKNMLLNCHYNKCMEYVVDTENAKLTDADKSQCYSKDFKKYIKCTDNMLRKKDIIKQMQRKVIVLVISALKYINILLII